MMGLLVGSTGSAVAVCTGMSLKLVNKDFQGNQCGREGERVRERGLKNKHRRRDTRHAQRSREREREIVPSPVVVSRMVVVSACSVVVSPTVVSLLGVVEGTAVVPTACTCGARSAMKAETK